ncbi:hypothetical protein R1flu_022836 [Riccia fluitans]|uniref:Uncharacterized protein n=1 Tax=Riccia fluitans TaxID=41844 RepID=A0ABD1XQU0_9MARC
MYIDSGLRSWLTAKTGLAIASVQVHVHLDVFLNHRNPFFWVIRIYGSVQAAGKEVIELPVHPYEGKAKANVDHHLPLLSGSLPSSFFFS